jgi:hypothetical protein
MTNREFNKVINSCRCKRRNSLKLEKIAALTDEVKADCVRYIVRNRGPVLAALIPAGFDMAWLHCMGYLHRTKGKEFEFVHTQEHRIV